MPESTKKRALKLLGSRNYSELEMHKKLTGKGESEENAREAVQWLAGLGYIDDSNYASLIAAHYTKKGYGPARIKEELAKRGIPRGMWDEKLAEANSDSGEGGGGSIGPAVEFLRKKLRNRGPDGSPGKDELKRARDALVRRGFSYDEANDAITRYTEQRSETAACPPETMKE